MDKANTFDVHLFIKRTKKNFFLHTFKIRESKNTITARPRFYMWVFCVREIKVEKTAQKKNV